MVTLVVSRFLLLVSHVIALDFSGTGTVTRHDAKDPLRRRLQDTSSDSDKEFVRNPNCKVHDITFILLEGDANLLAVEDDIRLHLNRFGFNVELRLLNKEDFNAAHQSGDFHLSFSETWGAPYDPHAYASGWVAGDEGHLQAMINVKPSRDELFEQIRAVFQAETHEARQEQWNLIHDTVHQNAIMLPLWGKRIPTVLNDRLVGYEAGNEQFAYPIHRLQVLSGPTRVTIAPGAQTGLFQSAGRLDPHSYRPNEFFANNWVYEGLVSYGPQGQVLPALASNWEVRDNGKIYTFNLRPEVFFHDGTPWNCAAASLNFDHVFVEPLRAPDWHGWYGLVEQMASWQCSDSMTLVVTLKSPYYPFLQELSFIRPLRMLSPAAFSQGNTTDPLTANSCPIEWGTIPGSDDESVVVTCAGIQNISGTGPFMFSSRDTSEADDGSTVDNQVVFRRNPTYWGGPPSIEELVVQRYESSDQVLAALKDKSLDVVWGSGVLQDQDLIALEQDDAVDLSVFHTQDLQNVILLLNSGKAPLDDITLRKTIFHAIDKKRIIDKELGGLQRPVDNIFPLDAPYCDVDLTPRWDLDAEKATFLNCMTEKDESSNKALALGLGLGLGTFCAVLIFVVIFFFSRTKKLENELQFVKSNGNQA